MRNIYRDAALARNRNEFAVFEGRKGSQWSWWDWRERGMRQIMEEGRHHGKKLGLYSYNKYSCFQARKSYHQFLLISRVTGQRAESREAGVEWKDRE